MPNLATTTECPPVAELEKLLRGRCTEARNAALCEHVGTCPVCQKKLEELAGSSSDLAAQLRECQEEAPPTNSAYWRALSSAENELRQTAIFPPNGNGTDNTPHPEGDLKLDFLQPPDKPDQLGKLAQFDIIRVLGRGGMGVVLHAFDPSLARDVAIKVIDPQLANNEVARQRFCREARAAAAVTHDNLVAVHQVNEDEPSGLPYLVMQLVNGESLEQRLKRVGRLSVPEVARLGMQAAAGLAAAHAGGLIHRDIKPANMLLESPVDRVKLTDFGLARAAEDVKLTRTGFVAGSPLYMAPEQARGEEVDPRADLFSLGTVLYEASIGTAPFEAKTPLAVLRRVSDETQMPLMRLNPEVPKWLSDAVDKLLSKEPQSRYQTAAEVAEVFAAGLVEMHQLSPLDVPAEVCPVSSRSSVASQRAPICWKAVGFRTLPWVGGAVLGGLIVGLLFTLLGKHVPANADPHHPDPELPPGAITSADELAKKLEDPKTTEISLGSGSFDLAGMLQGKESELVVTTTGPTRLLLAANPGPAPKVTLPGESGTVWATAFLKDNRLVMGMEDGSLKIWDLRTSEPIRTLDRQVGNIWTVDVSPDGKYLATGSDDSDVTFWNLNDYRRELSFPSSTSTKAVAFSPDGKLLATGNRNSTVQVWDWANQVRIKELSGHRGTIHAVAFSPDGKRLASAGADGTIKVWEVKPDEWQMPDKGPLPLMEMTLHRASVYSVAYSPDGTKIVSSGWDGTVRVWDANNGTQLQKIQAHKGGVWSVAFGEKGDWVASAGDDSFVRVWEVKTGKEVFSYRGGRSFNVVRFAPDGTTLAAGSRDGTVRVWELKK